MFAGVLTWAGTKKCLMTSSPGPDVESAEDPHVGVTWLTLLRMSHVVPLTAEHSQICCVLQREERSFGWQVQERREVLEDEGG